MPLDGQPYDAITQLIEPLAQAYLRAGLGAGEFLLAAKHAFIKAAATSRTTDGKLNISAIAVATGLTRKETKTILDSMREKGRPTTKHSSRQRSARVVQGWRTDPSFMELTGRPARLPMRGSAASFEALVRRYGGDVTYASVLAELQRRGAVSLSKDGAVLLRSNHLSERNVEREAIAQMAHQLRDLAGALAWNLESDDRPTFTAFRETKSLSPDVAAVFVKTFTERSAMLLESAEQWFALQPKQRHTQKQGENSAHRVGIGVYLVDEPAGSRKPMPPRRQHRRKAKAPTPV